MPRRRTSSNSRPRSWGGLWRSASGNASSGIGSRASECFPVVGVIAGKPKFYYIQVSLAPPLASWWTTLAGWSALGSAIGGLSAAVLAVTAFIGGGAPLKRWRGKRHPQREPAEVRANATRP